MSVESHTVHTGVHLNDDSLSDCVQYPLGRAMQIQFLHHVCPVRFHSGHAQSEQICHILIRPALCEQLQNLFLTIRQKIVRIFETALPR